MKSVGRRERTDRRTDGRMTACLSVTVLLPVECLRTPNLRQPASAPSIAVRCSNHMKVASSTSPRPFEESRSLNPSGKPALINPSVDYNAVGVHEHDYLSVHERRKVREEIKSKKRRAESASSSGVTSADTTGESASASASASG